jgi:hypothetical protein
MLTLTAANGCLSKPLSIATTLSPLYTNKHVPSPAAVLRPGTWPFTVGSHRPVLWGVQGRARFCYMIDRESSLATLQSMFVQSNTGKTTLTFANWCLITPGAAVLTYPLLYTNKFKSLVTCVDCLATHSVVADYHRSTLKIIQVRTSDGYNIKLHALKSCKQGAGEFPLRLQIGSSSV